MYGLVTAWAGVSRTSAGVAVPARDGVSCLTGAVGGPLYYAAT